MRLTINYDFFSAIRDVNEPYGALKIVRNNKMRYMAYFPVWTTIDYALIRNTPETIGFVVFQYILALGSDLIIDRDSGIDPYATKAAKRLKKLVSALEDINVKTEYQLLLDSVLYAKEYKVERNNKGTFLKEEKYIYVPSFNYNGDIRDKSILQEHALGTDVYVLSIGECQKQYHRVLVRT